MAYFDYADVKGFLGDAELVRLLCADRTYPQLLDAFMQEDFLAIATRFCVTVRSDDGCTLR